MEKYQGDGHWCFRTKGDNNTEVDPWKVPDYWVTGIVVGIEHSTNPSTQTSPAEPIDRSTHPPREHSGPLEFPSSLLVPFVFQHDLLIDR